MISLCVSEMPLFLVLELWRAHGLYSCIALGNASVLRAQVEVVLRGRQTRDEQIYVKLDKALASGGVTGGTATGTPGIRW